ncbi:hypothetical protein SAMN05660748_2261 [Blastococcus aggregatus]|uniref:Uncharacterized protein n=1 Tax=Blastococcus aggregatus TaxID=38502 RepID=A0A285V690_9ACTN|nr:hypothetical protein [Blastococcus aggregatus]SOC49533.1 hypothetical protein SAMN05660748_2261 [Blastococcus aggregatus]
MTDGLVLARERADALALELHRLDGALTTEERAQVSRRLAHVGEQCLAPRTTDSTSLRHRLRTWWRGDELLHSAWYQLHEIELDLRTKDPDVAEIVLDARGHVAKELPKAAWKQFEERLRAAGLDQEARRVLALDAIRRSHRAAEARHDGERQRRRGIYSISAALLFMALLVALLQAFSSEPFIQPPADGMGISPRFLLVLVMIFGALGGLVSGLVSLYIRQTDFSDAIWFDPRPMLVAAKFVMGIWTAVIGIVAVGSGLLVGAYTSVASALLLAFIFGYGQQAVTGFLDRKVAEVSEDAG